LPIKPLEIENFLRILPELAVISELAQVRGTAPTCGIVLAAI
jgi:hypothetical protein